MLTTSLVLVLLGATGLWQYRQLSNEYVSLMREQQQALTAIAAADVDYKLGMHLGLLARAAQRADGPAFSDASARQKFLADSDLRPMFDGIALIGLDGTVLANDPPLDKPLNIADRPYFRRALDTAAPTISAPLLARSTRQPAILMAAPVKNADGQLVGIVGAGLDLGRPNVLGDLGRSSVGKGGFYVIATRGPAPVYVMHPDPRLLLQPATPAADRVQEGTSRDLATSAAIHSVDWELRVVVPAHAAYAPLDRARHALLLQMLWLGLACGALVWAGTAWLMRPLAALYDAIRVLRQSPDSPVKLGVHANDERGDLAREFDALMTELRHQRAEIAAVTDASPLGMFRCDTEGRMVYVNDAYLDIQGLARPEAAEGWLTLLPEANRERVQQDWKRIVREAKPFHTTRRLRRRDGSEVLVSLRMRPILADGRLTGHVGTLADITERTRAEQALHTLTAIFEATTDYVVQLDTKGHLVYMNPAARLRAGLAADAPIAQSKVDDFNPPETIVRLRDEIVPTAVANGIWVGESVAWDAEHRRFPVSHMVIAHRDSNGKVGYFSALLRDISAAKETELALRQSEERLRMITDHLPVLISYLDRDLHLRFVNKTFQEWFDVDPAQLIGTGLQEFYSEQVWAQIKPDMQAALAGRQVVHEREMTRGKVRRHVQAILVPDHDEQGQVIGLYTLLSDVTEHRDAELALQESEARLRTVANALPMRVAYIDAHERYQFNNLADARSFGRSLHEIQGRTVRELLGESAYRSVQPHIKAALQGEAVSFQGEMTSHDSYACFEANYIPQRAADGASVVGFHAVITDITRQKREERRLVQLARVDPLTGLGNRAGFEVRLAEAMGRSRAEHMLMALMYLDIDRFKQVNDSLGHQTGDALLKAFAGRLTQTVRSTDFVGRLGGDEFIVMMEDLSLPEVAAMVADKIVRTMRAVFLLDAQAVQVTASIGVAFYDGGASSAETLVRQADEMLYQAKATGRDNYQAAAFPPAQAAERP
ncbi:MAG TPA: PAS domain-containing protein [Burkholderiaceae bacterium]|nr:PAS domain-containing protein [Burkholderiaceae bacterium]